MHSSPGGSANHAIRHLPDAPARPLRRTTDMNHPAFEMRGWSSVRDFLTGSQVRALLGIEGV